MIIADSSEGIFGGELKKKIPSMITKVAVWPCGMSESLMALIFALMSFTFVHIVWYLII